MFLMLSLLAFLMTVMVTRTVLEKEAPQGHRQGSDIQEEHKNIHKKHVSLAQLKRKRKRLSYKDTKKQQQEAVDQLVSLYRASNHSYLLITFTNHGQSDFTKVIRTIFSYFVHWNWPSGRISNYIVMHGCFEGNNSSSGISGIGRGGEVLQNLFDQRPRYYS